MNSRQLWSSGLSCYCDLHSSTRLLHMKGILKTARSLFFIVVHWSSYGPESGLRLSDHHCHSLYLNFKSYVGPVSPFSLSYISTKLQKEFGQSFWHLNALLYHSSFRSISSVLPKLYCLTFPSHPPSQRFHLWPKFSFSLWLYSHLQPLLKGAKLCIEFRKNGLWDPDCVARPNKFVT